MVRERLTDRLREHASEMVEKIVERMPGSLRRFRDVEKVLKEATEELEARCLQSWCDEAKDDSPSPRCLHCRERMRQKDGKEKRVICHGGNVAVKRKRWRCEQCGESFFPSG